MKRFILKGLLAAVLLVGAAEVGARWVLPALFGRGIAELEDYYRPVQRAAAAGPITHLFVGSSQVAAAVDADTFQVLMRTAAAPAERERIRVIDRGKGFSRQAQHYLGVRNLIERYPDSMRGVVVFLEAPGGIADFGTWEDDWTFPKWPSLLGPLLRLDDLPRFYLHADNSFGDKARVTAAHFLHTARYVRHVRLRMEGAVNRRLAPPPDEREREADLTTEGGIRTDREGVELTRIEAMRQRNERWVEAQGAGGREASDWERSVWADLVRLVRAHGGDVVFFETPQSPIMYVGGRDQVFMERRHAFETWARANDLPVLHPQPFVYGVEDFPDDLHLRASRSGEYTARLAEAYLAWERNRDAARPQ